MEDSSAKKSAAKTAQPEFKSLAVGLVGLLSLIIGFLLAIGLSTPVGVALGCADQAYNYGCGVPGFVLGIIIALIAAPIFLRRVLKVKKPILVVFLSTIALFLIYSLTGQYVGTFVTQDSLSWVILAYAIVYGLLFTLFTNVTDSGAKLAQSLTAKNKPKLLGGVLAVIALVIIFFMVVMIWGPRSY